MKKAILAGLGLTVAIAPLVLVAQTSSKPAMYITKEEVDIVNKQPGTDRTIKVMDIGPENFSVGIIHRGPTGAAARGAAPAAAPGGGAARSTAAQQPACGEQASTPPAPGSPNGLFHDQQTEGYYIVSGGGTMVTGGHIINGRRSAPDDEVTTTLNGPSCSGFIGGSDVVLKEVKQGDIVIIPAGTPHGWTTITDHVDYLSFRPSARVLAAGYVHPSIKK